MLTAETTYLAHTYILTDNTTAQSERLERAPYASTAACPTWQRSLVTINHSQRPRRIRLHANQHSTAGISCQVAVTELQLRLWKVLDGCQLACPQTGTMTKQKDHELARATGQLGKLCLSTLVMHETDKGCTEDEGTV